MHLPCLVSPGALGVTILSLAACSGNAGSDRPPRPPIAAESGASAAPAASGDQYVGHHYAGLPDGVRYLSGTVVPSATPSGPAVYDFAHVRTPRGDRLWLDSLGRQADGVPERIVLASLAVPPLGTDERLFLSSCDVRGTLDRWVVAVVIDQPNASRFTRIRQAWRADPERRAFEMIPVEGITCEEP